MNTENLEHQTKNDMKQFKILFRISFIAFLIIGCSNQNEDKKNQDTYSNEGVDLIENLNYVNGYPTDKTSQILYDEMDLQRATQAYLWGFPLVSAASIRRGLFNDLGLNYNDIVLYENYLDTKSIWFTGNNTTIYGAAMIDLAKDGPIVIELPKALQAGMINDYWWRTRGIGNLGPDKGQGGKYFIVPPDYTEEIPKDGYFVVNSDMNDYMFFLRGFVENDNVESAVQLFYDVKIYPYSQRHNPKPNKVFPSTGKHINTIEPDGIEFWQLLSDVINNNQVDERDRIMLAMLKPLGIIKGEPFNPNERQKQILLKAAKLGKMMAQTISFNPRIPEAQAYDGKQWKHVFTLNTKEGEHQESEFYTQLDERLHYLYLGTWPAQAMNLPYPSNGQRYLESFKDKNGDWLDGSKHYKLHVPANVPSVRFWSVTVYDNKTRSMTMNQENKAAITSYDNLSYNDDGSVDLYFGPSAPNELENNWVNTSASQGWFVWFRFYGTKESFFDGSWQLEDFELLDNN